MLMILQKLFQPIMICARRRLEAKSWREEIPVEWIVSIKGLRFRSFPGRVLACVCSSTSHSVKTIYGVNIFKCQSYFPKGEYYYKPVYWRKEGNILLKNKKRCGLNRDLNPGPLAPKARIIPLDHWAICICWGQKCGLDGSQVLVVEAANWIWSILHLFPSMPL